MRIEMGGTIIAICFVVILLVAVISLVSRYRGRAHAETQEPRAWQSTEVKNVFYFETEKARCYGFADGYAGGLSCEWKPAK